MIYDCNIILIFIACMFLVALLFGKKEGFRDIDPHNNSGYIPYVPQDIICLALKAAKVDIDRLGVFKDKCMYKKNDTKPDDSNICRA